MKRLSGMLAMLLVVTAGVYAQDASKKTVDVTGVWESSVESSMGTTSSTATYKQEGETLTGTHAGQFGEFALKGTVKGTAISYQLTIAVQGQQIVVTYAGTVDGDKITGTADIGGMGSGTWTVKRKR